MNSTFSNYKHIETVTTFSELTQTNFKGEKNAKCWFRKLQGDFKEIVSKLQLKENITEVYPEDLMELQLSEEGNSAREIIINDLQLLTDFGASPVLNLIKSYERDDTLDFIATDVYSYHVDRSPIAIDTYLCTYYGVASDIIANEQVTQKILVPEIREQLKVLHKDPSVDFEDFLMDNYFDLHYQPKFNVVPINLGVGHLWRLAVDHPNNEVLPCVHRAPIEIEGEYRLLLIC